MLCLNASHLHQLVTMALYQIVFKF